MQGIITIMIILVFLPVVFAIYILYKRMHEEPKDNKSREILLQAMCLEELRKKKGEAAVSDDQVSEKTADEQKDSAGNGDSGCGEKHETPQIDEQTRKAMQIAKETLYTQDYQRKKEEDDQDSKKKAAAEMVLEMMKNKGRSGASREELQEMINVLSDKNK